MELVARMKETESRWVSDPKKVALMREWLKDLPLRLQAHTAEAE